MSKKNYNVFFNTHTVSGIVISVALYVIFFAGAFSLFKDEIEIWEDGKSISNSKREQIDYDKIFKSLENEYELTGRDLQINFGHGKDKIYVFMDASKDSLASKKAKTETPYYAIDIHSLDKKHYEEHYNLGEFLYRLHFLAQIPVYGIYLAGLIALFFLFAIVTGVIVHWKKIIENFYSFNPKVALKRVWTDAHTALGVIGLPFQFIFAVTGAYFCLSVLVLIPANILYNGNTDKLLSDLRPDRITYKWEKSTTETIPSYNDFAKEVANKWDNFNITRGFVRNYGGTNMKYLVMGEIDDKERFVGTGIVTKDAFSNSEELTISPLENSYTDDVQNVMGRLHFGSFGGVALKIIYFILALLTCFVIITGVLIWIEARNKKSKTFRQRLYTAKVGHIYLAICLTMLPVTALSFLFVKFTNGLFINKQIAIYSFYFVTWLVFIIGFRFKRDNYFTNKICLLLGAIFGFLIPISNGIVSKQWMWTSYTNNQFDMLTIDILWIIIATLSLIAYLKIKPQVKEKSAFTKLPIDYKNRKTILAKEEQKLNILSTENQKTTDKNHISMRTKIVILWIFLALGWIVHHIYGLFNIYYNETLIIEGATGKAPIIHHIYRILFEGLCLLFALLTIEVSKKWFKTTSLIWAIIAGVYNLYHFIEASIFESGNISEIFMLLLVSIASIFLVKNLYQWKKE